MKPTTPATPADDHHARVQARAGLLYALAAFGSWGLAPLYFRAALEYGRPFEILAHRIVWAVILLAMLMTIRRQWGTVRRTLVESPRTWTVLLLTTVLIGCNWYLFIWTIDEKKLLQASLGYFINPLLSVLLGFVFLRERLTRVQTAGVVLAATGVAWYTIRLGEPPTVALMLATSFAVYSLLRKTAKVDALAGLTVETALLLPFALGYVVHLHRAGEGGFGQGDVRADLLLMAAGPVTMLPLLWFTNAARRLRLTTVGILQYLSPSAQFAVAVYLFGEPMSADKLVAFAFIWTALALYTADAILTIRRQRRREVALTDGSGVAVLEPGAK